MFKIRCSAIGQIMTDPRSKADKDAGNLSQTAKTYCETWLKEKIYMRFKEFQTKYTIKGVEVEGDAIDYIAKVQGMGMIVKNEERFENDFLQGTPDVVTADTVIDNKSSWDCFTFPLFATEIPEKAYWWQLQGYMALTGKQQAELIYTLMDAPEWLIEQEVDKELRFNRVIPDDVNLDVIQQMGNKYRYSSIDDSKRIKIFKIARDDNAIKAIEQRVMKCREYIELLTNQLNQK